MPKTKESTWEEKLDATMKNVEKKLNDLGEKLDEKSEEWGRKAEVKARELTKKAEKTRGGSSVFWGIVLLVVGFAWLGRNLHWFFFDVPWFPLILIAAGIYVIIRNWDKNEKEEKSMKK